MTKRSVLYVVIVVIALNVVHIAVLAFAALSIGRPHRPPLAAVRSKIETSASFEDLRPRALYIMSANEASDRAIVHLHEAISHLIKLSMASVAGSLLFLCFLVPSLVRGDTKI